jgi:hypothetical protein
MSSKKQSKGRKGIAAKLRAEQLSHLRREDQRDMLVPPPLPGRFSMNLRYQQTAAGTSTVTWGSLFALMGYTTSTTTYKSLLEAVKIRKLHIWIPGNSASSGSAVLTNVAGLSIKDSIVPGLGVEKTMQLYSSGIEPAYLCYKFKGAFADWCNYEFVGSYSSEVLFSILTVGAAAIVQIDLSVQLLVSNSTSQPGFEITVDTTVAERIAFLYLDGLSNLTLEGTQLLAPVGLVAVTANMPEPLSAAPLPAVVSSSSSSSGRVVGSLLPALRRA